MSKVVANLDCKVTLTFKKSNSQYRTLWWTWRQSSLCAWQHGHRFRIGSCWWSLAFVGKMPWTSLMMCVLLAMFCWILCPCSVQFIVSNVIWVHWFRSRRCTRSDSAVAWYCSADSLWLVTVPVGRMRWAPAHFVIKTSGSCVPSSRWYLLASSSASTFSWARSGSRWKVVFLSWCPLMCWSSNPGMSLRSCWMPTTTTSHSGDKGLRGRW